MLCILIFHFSQLFITFETYLNEDGCGGDLKNVLINLYNGEDELTPQVVNVNSESISPTYDKIHNNIVEIAVEYNIFFFLL